jgi:hypothetical protein
MTMKSVGGLLALPLLAAACAHPAPRPGVPSRADLESALMPLDFCAGEDSGACDSGPFPDHIRLIASRCAPLPPREGKRVVACRVTFRHIYNRFPRMDRTYARQCGVFVAESAPPGAPLYWSTQWFEKGDACGNAGI